MSHRLQLAQRIAGYALALAVVLIPLLIAAPSLHAQGCAMCYNNAAATGPQGTKVLRHAILVLLIPPATMFCGILGLLYQRRNSSR